MTKITSKSLEVTPLIRERVQARLNKLARHFPSFNSQFISPQVGNIFSQTACLMPIK